MEDKHIVEDLKFMRFMIEKTHREIDPGVSMFIAWGILLMIGYIGSYVLISVNARNLINPMWLALYAVGFLSSAFLIHRLVKRQIIEGIVSYVYKQICWLWCILGASGTIWLNFGLGRKFFGDIDFVWAWIIGIGLLVMGIIHLKQWLIGGLGVFAGIAVAVFIPGYQNIVLGGAVGFGFIVPALITLRRLKRLHKNGQK